MDLCSGYGPASPDFLQQDDIGKNSTPVFSDRACGGWRDGERESLGRRLIEAVVGVAFAVELEDLQKASRGRAKVAFARQVAMYLAHVQFGWSLSEVGRIFGRDRTTVSHACALVEDRRDEPQFDHVLELLERVVAAQFSPRATGCVSG